jgi:hypothetical protein
LTKGCQVLRCCISFFRRDGNFFGNFEAALKKLLSCLVKIIYNQLFEILGLYNCREVIWFHGRHVKKKITAEYLIKIHGNSIADAAELKHRNGRWD